MMRKVTRKQGLLLALAGTLALIICLLNGGSAWLRGRIPTASAYGSGNSIGGKLASNSSSGACTNEHHGPSFGGAVVVDTKQVECGNVIAFGGTVAINGEVKGDVIAFSSAVVVAGTVDGNIRLFGGNVILQSGSHVHGDIQLYVASWTRGPNTQLDGSVSDLTGNVNWLFTGNGGWAVSFWFLIIWLAVGLGLTTFLPEHVMFVRTTAVSKARRSFVIGLLTIILGPTMLVVLIALVLPIPLAIIVGLGLIVAWMLGTVAIGWYAGDYILSKIAPNQNTRPLQVVVGLTVLVLAGSLPYIGWFISISTGLLGLGAVFLSRFGTRLYGQPRQPLTL